MPKKRKDFEVGYGKPPKQHRFKPRQSGNRKGRPRKPTTLKGFLEGEFGKTISIREGGKVKKVSKMEAIVISSFNKAMSGDLRALKFVMECLPKQKGGMIEKTADEKRAELMVRLQELSSQRIEESESEMLDIRRNLVRCGVPKDIIDDLLGAKEGEEIELEEENRRQRRQAALVAARAYNLPEILIKRIEKKAPTRKDNK